MKFQSLVTILVLLGVLVHAQNDQSGFISIDCGIAKGLTYTDNVTGINYISDAEFRDSGEIHSIMPAYNSLDIYKHATTLTSFPQNTRNCYTLNPTQGKGNRYLIRASFMYGNYDLKGQLPEFDVYLGTEYWDTMKFNSSSQPIKMEIIHVSSTDYIHLCLVNIGRGTPFISAIELRLVAGDMYKETDFGSLYLYARANLGTTLGTVRYSNDKYDRVWSPINWSDSTFLYTREQVSVGLLNVFDPPSEVMNSAATPRNPNDPFIIEWDPFNTNDKFFIYMHFAEVELLKENQTREFNIYLNGNLTYGPFSPIYLNAASIYSTVPETIAPRYTLIINKTKNSTLPPIINALELYVLKQLPQRQTDHHDVAAIGSIKSYYRVTRNWQGDPCAPQEFVWDGLRCSYNDTEMSRITFLNLSTSGIKGKIDRGFSYLTMIETLDLSNNNLTGTVPDFLSGMKFLKVLNLRGNNFIGPIPEELLAKSKNGSLSISFDGQSTDEDASSCVMNRCKNKKDKKFIVPVIATVVSLFVILTAITTIWIINKQKAQDKSKTSTDGLEIKRQKFTYSEIKSITDNFKVVIGKGGFGEVYHGYIGDVQVAVKMLSASSQQGDKEFQAEANLLMSVHHKNLTTLVGYCNEGNHKGIIYDYIANGNLENHLFGLEYLHHGCTPPIVHRDVKCTNILLNEKFQAKLADFGLSRAFPTEGATHISTLVAGTPGYLDPEYQSSYRLTEKSDVYSFGVVLMVIITGRPAIARYDNDNKHISRWVNLKLSDGNVKSLIDPRLQGEFDINSAGKAVELALTCVDDMPNRRPTMKEVVMGLSDCLETLQECKPENLTGIISLTLENAT
ncbi:unnamed protein product [Lactuca virosa]|uniref:Protein kinase domain-containing protein n=1 Tax=Lactuca virosa TaxID=75947 RepID=A0AAU9MT38_9ASTR|nr:unnamed protein product [Lactuca virosa]